MPTFKVNLIFHTHKFHALQSTVLMLLLSKRIESDSETKKPTETSCGFYFINGEWGRYLTNTLLTDGRISLLSE